MQPANTKPIFTPLLARAIGIVAAPLIANRVDFNVMFYEDSRATVLSFAPGSDEPVREWLICVSPGGHTTIDIQDPPESEDAQGG